MKKIVSVLLMISIFTSMIIPVKAAEENSCFEYETVFSTIGEDGSYEEMISTGSVLLYYYENESVRKSASYSIESGYLDYVEYIVGSEFFSRTQKVLPQSLSPNELCEYVNMTKNMLTSIVPVNSIITEFREEVTTTSVSDTDRNKILTALYNNSEPSEFTNENSRTVVVESKAVLIKESLSYSIKEKSVFPVLARTAITVISALVSLPSSTLLKIATFVSVGNGIYELVKDYDFKKMEVVGMRVKDCYIDNTKYYQSWLRKQWTAVVGDIGAALNFEQGTCDEYFYNDRKIAEFAYANYKAGSIYPYFELERLLVK